MRPGSRSPIISPTGLGLGLTLMSALFFSWLGVVTKLAYHAGATVGTVLSGRFVLAAVALWGLVFLTRARRPTRAQTVAGLVLGVGYSVHGLLFSGALTRLDAGLVDLLLFTYPALVVLGAIALRRDRWNRRRTLALIASGAGTTLVLIGGIGHIDVLGAALALGASAAYAVYILVSAGRLERMDPLVLVALVSTGAATTLTLGSALRRDVSFELGAPALLRVAAVGVVAAGGMSTFIAGIDRLGPARASVVSAIQPALTPIVGFAVFGDRLGPTQLGGGVLVIAAIVILEAHRRPTSLAWLPRRERRRLRRFGAHHQIPAGVRVVSEGEVAEAFFLIERGSVTVTRGAAQALRLGPGDFFGEIALFNGGTRTASVVADTELRVRVVPSERFGPLLRRLPTLAYAVRDAVRDRLPASTYQPAHGH